MLCLVLGLGSRREAVIQWPVEIMARSSAREEDLSGQADDILALPKKCSKMEYT